MNLFLRFQFTDRAGRYVFNMLKYEDGDVIGQIRLHPDKDDNVLLEWTEPEPEE